MTSRRLALIALAAVSIEGAARADAIDAWPPFEAAMKRGDPASLFATAMPHDVHFSAEGNALLARFLHDELAAK